MERGAGAPPQGSEIEHVAVDLCTVDLWIVPHHAIRGLNAAVIIERFQQFLIAANIVPFDVILNALIVLNPEHNIPGFVVSPTAVGNIQQVGLVSAGCGCHGVQV